jgi:hypothetical protein
MGMRTVGALLFAALVAPLAGACTHPCPSADTLLSAGSGTFVGVMGSASGDGGGVVDSTKGEVAQTFPASVALVAFDPGVSKQTQDSDDTYYCGPAVFTVAVLGVCSLTADVGKVLYDSGDDATGAFVSASATIRAGQSCTLDADPSDSDADPRTLVITAGTLSLLPGNLTVTLSGTVNGVYSTFAFSGAPPTRVDG